MHKQIQERHENRFNLIPSRLSAVESRVAMKDERYKLSMMKAGMMADFIEKVCSRLENAFDSSSGCCCNGCCDGCCDGCCCIVLYT